MQNKPLWLPVQAKLHHGLLRLPDKIHNYATRLQCSNFSSQRSVLKNSVIFGASLKWNKQPYTMRELAATASLKT